MFQRGENFLVRARLAQLVNLVQLDGLGQQLLDRFIEAQEMRRLQVRVERLLRLPKFVEEEMAGSFGFIQPVELVRGFSVRRRKHQLADLLQFVGFAVLGNQRDNQFDFHLTRAMREAKLVFRATRADFLG